MIEILAVGALATVQDLGRFGYTDIGVGRSGAADQSSHRLANRLVGNEDRAATIELTMGGLSFRLTTAATISLTGAPCQAYGGGPLPWNTARTLPANTAVRIGVPRWGLRSYLAVRGGVDAVPVLGSRSRDTLSGLGPPPLAAGTVLPIGVLVSGEPSDDPVPHSTPGETTVRVLAGPRLDWFTDEAWPLLLGSSWSVQADSNRIGLRLAGAVLSRAHTNELASEPTLPGAIQVPPSGQPIVLGPDAPVTGGYPVIGVVASVDLDQLAQLRPGDALRFRR